MLPCERSLVTDWFDYSGSTYPLDLVRSRLSIATASVSLVTPAAATGPKVAPISSIPGQVTHVLASAHHTAALPKYTKTDLTIWGMTLKIIREEGGVKGLYRGLAATAFGVAPYVGINFATYEFLRGIITPPGKSGVARKLSCGALAGRLLCGIPHWRAPNFFRIYIADVDIPI